MSDREQAKKRNATCYAMAAVLRMWLEGGDKRPVFRLPFKEIGLIASLEGELVDHIAGNDAAKKLLAIFAKAFPDNDTPTVMMLEAAMMSVGIEPERVPLVDLRVPWPSSSVEGDN